MIATMYSSRNAVKVPRPAPTAPDFRRQEGEPRVDAALVMKMSRYSSHDAPCPPVAGSTASSIASSRLSSLEYAKQLRSLKLLPLHHLGHKGAHLRAIGVGARLGRAGERGAGGKRTHSAARTMVGAFMSLAHSRHQALIVRRFRRRRVGAVAQPRYSSADPSNGGTRPRQAARRGAPRSRAVLRPLRAPPPVRRACGQNTDPRRAAPGIRPRQAPSDHAESSVIRIPK